MPETQEPAADYHPVHHEPQPTPQAGVPPLHPASPEVSHQQVATEQPDGDAVATHGNVRAETSDKLVGLRQRAPERKATGLAAVVSSFNYAWGEAGIIRGTLPLLQLNQKGGFDCPGCAWPDPDGTRSHFDFCENGAKAVAHESDRRRVTAEFFASHAVADLSRQSDYWLEQQGRLIEPMVLRAGATHYQPISWD